MVTAAVSAYYCLWCVVAFDQQKAAAVLCECAGVERCTTTAVAAHTTAAKTTCYNNDAQIKPNQSIIIFVIKGEAGGGAA